MQRVVVATSTVVRTIPGMTPIIAVVRTTQGTTTPRMTTTAMAQAQGHLVAASFCLASPRDHHVLFGCGVCTVSLSAPTDQVVPHSYTEIERSVSQFALPPVGRCYKTEHATRIYGAGADAAAPAAARRKSLANCCQLLTDPSSIT